MQTGLGKMRNRRTKNQEPDFIRNGRHASNLANIFMKEFITYRSKSGSLPVQVIFDAIAIFIKKLLFGFSVTWTEQVFDDQFAKLWKVEKQMRDLMSSRFLDYRLCHGVMLPSLPEIGPK
jgi:hypothetical protein